MLFVSGTTSTSPSSVTETSSHEAAFSEDTSSTVSPSSVKVIPSIAALSFDAVCFASSVVSSASISVIFALIEMLGASPAARIVSPEARAWMGLAFASCSATEAARSDASMPCPISSGTTVYAPSTNVICALTGSTY